MSLKTILNNKRDPESAVAVGLHASDINTALDDEMFTDEELDVDL